MRMRIVIEEKKWEAVCLLNVRSWADPRCSLFFMGDRNLMRA